MPLGTLGAKRLFVAPFYYKRYNIFMVKKLAVLLLCTLFTLAALPCQTVSATESAATDDGVYITDDSFNTENIINLYGANATEAAEAIVAEFEIIDDLFSLTKDSQIAELNQNGVLYNADQRVIYLLGRALELFGLTSGAFNPATYLLTDLWQLSSRFSDGEPAETRPYDRALYTLPEQKYIDAFKELLNFDDIVIDGDTVYLPENSVTVDGVEYHMMIDLGGIVKGYAAARAKEIASEYGITQGYISLGGSSIVFLTNPNDDGGDFTVGIINPDNISTYYARISVSNIAMSTSGDYQPGKYFELDGKRYSHIIDGETGAPVDTGVRTVSIICDDPILADALTTAIMVMGYDEARAKINGDYFISNEIKTAIVYERQWLFGSVKEVVTNTTADFWQITAAGYSLCGYMAEDGTFVYNAKNPNLWLFLSVAGLVAAILIIIAIVRRKGKPIRDTKKQKFFRLGDIIVYAATFACVLALFLGFVVFRDVSSLEQVKIYLGSDVIYVFDMTSATGEIIEGCESYVFAHVEDGVTYVTIYTDGHTNVVAIDSDGAEMVEADCSNTKECVNNFPKITSGDSVIICNVTHIKVVGSGGSELPIISG